MTATVAPRGGCTSGIVISEVEGVSKLPLLGRTTGYVLANTHAHAHTHLHAQPHGQTRTHMHICSHVRDGDGVEVNTCMQLSHICASMYGCLWSV